MSERYPGGVITKNAIVPTPSSAPGVWTLDQQLQAQQAGTWPFGGPFTYIEDVFSTYLYTGNGSTQTITNGIDLSTYGGLVWLKSRNTSAISHGLFDSARGFTNVNGNYLNTASTSGGGAFEGSFAGVSTTGFFLTNGNYNSSNTSFNQYVSWTFRKQPKFFDVVTYTGNGNSSNQIISHNLQSIPGFIVVKRTDSTGNWYVWNQNNGTNQYLLLNTTDAIQNATNIWGTTTPDETTFRVGNNTTTNINGATYVAYLFANQAGGFGLTGTDNVISCGSFTTDSGGSTTAPVNLGYEPQWVLLKRTNSTQDWFLIDNMRQMSLADSALLRPNSSAAENLNGAAAAAPTATGFYSNGGLGISSTYIYIAIRRGPMKTPTSGTSVFSPQAVTGGTNMVMTFSTLPYVDSITSFKDRTTGGAYNAPSWQDRLRGFPSVPGATYPTNDPTLNSSATTAEATGSSGSFLSSVVMNSASWGGGWTGYSGVGYGFRRAPGFFDEVCYTGTGSATTVTHNLGVAPEMVIIKRRDSAAGAGWFTWTSGLTSATYALVLQTTDAQSNFGTNYFSSAPTSSVLNLGSQVSVNGSGSTYVAYLFASCPGVSKVGSYTGTGATQTINCGFTGGARFVLIKRTDSTGDWYVWDTARGMVSGTDPSLLLNSTAAEVNANSVYTTSVGFQIVSTAAGINASGGSYIFLAIA